MTAKLIPLPEQQAIIEAAKTGKNLVISAKAGSGKSSVCIMVAETLANHSLMVCFNKSIAEENSRKFPKTTQCSTIHSLAWKAIVKNSNSALGKRLKGNFNLFDIPVTPKLPKEDVMQYRKDIRKLVESFCQSDSFNIRDFLTDELAAPASALMFKNLKLSVVGKDAADFWDFLQTSQTSPISHDFYLKLFQLSKPILGFDTIYGDEFQDQNKVVIDILLRQPCQIIAVGDKFQQLYAWKGAVNAMNALENFTPLTLSTSFRFTQDIADKANLLLTSAGEKVKIIGAGKGGELVSRCFIVRSNASMIELLIQAEARGDKVKIFCDLKELWGKLYHLEALKFDKELKFPDKELSVYKTYKEVLAAAKTDPELSKYVSILNLLKKSVYATGQDISSILVAQGETYTVCTAHKSKGLEFDHVVLSEDLIALRRKENGDMETVGEFLSRDDNLNLVYVALTRAKTRVDLPLLLQEWLEELANGGK